MFQKYKKVAVNIEQEILQYNVYYLSGKKTKALISLHGWAADNLPLSYSYAKGMFSHYVTHLY